MNKNLFEKIMNYLLQYDFQNIKLIYIEKEKYINTIIMNKVKTNIVEEKGFSISFYHKDQPFFIALNNLDKFSIAKKRINEIVKNKKRVTAKEPFVIKEINVKEKNFDRFDVDKYRNDLSRFTLENKDLLDISIPLLSERKKTYIFSPTKTIFKEEYNYKLDIIMKAIIDNKNRFNYFSCGSSDDLGRIKEVNVYDELTSLYHVIKKMKSMDHFKKKTDVVMASGIGGIIIHEACGHALESREINKNTSVLNHVNKISNKDITIIDNPKIKNEFGSFWIDDEGNNAKTIKLIENGEVKEYLYDEKSSIHNDSSSGRRESYYDMPSSRMSNTYIENGKERADSIIQSVPNGFYIKNILNGVVDTISGNFSFNCLESYPIKNGKIDNSICYDNLTIMGNTLDLLKNIDKIGNDLKRSSGICGSEGGLIYTTVGEPTIKIKNLLVVSQK